MARIKLVKSSTSITKRNLNNYVSVYLPYINLIAIIGLAFKVFIK